MPTLVGVTALEGPKVDASPTTEGLFDEPAEPPPPVPVHGVDGADSLHQVQVTVPAGGPPSELPVTVAESVHVLPTEVAPGVLIAVVKSGVAGLTVTHSFWSTVPVWLSVEPR